MSRITQLFRALAAVSRVSPLLVACLIGAIGSLSSCGGGGGSGSGDSGDGIRASLEGLGIDVSESPRLDENGDPLPSDYNPLGLTFQVDPLMELYVGGVQLAGSTAVATLIEDVSQATPDVNGLIVPTTLFELQDVDAPWWTEGLSSNSFRETLRACAASDLDGDGVDEIVTVFADDPQLRIQIVEAGDAGLEANESTLLFNTTGITNVAVACGDFDGDSVDDLAVGYCADGLALLLRLVRDEFGSFSIEPNTQRTFYPNLVDPSLELILDAGNLDNDDSLELVALLNETAGSFGAPAMTSRYYVLDDRTQGYQELHSAFVEGFETGVGLHVAAVADLAFGDIDGDNRDEIVFGGLAYLDTGCNGTPHVFVAVDDAAASFASLGAARIDVDLDGCANGPTPYDLRFVHVNTLDLDDDGVDEVQANHLVFEDWTNAEPWTLVDAYSLSSHEIVDESGQEFFDRTNSAIATGDVDGDGREDILVYRDGNQEVRIFGLVEGETQVRELAHLATTQSSALVNPVLLPVNVDKDTKVVRATGVKRLAYIEPVVAAVLAAPPCKFGIGQNTDVCQTTFGNTTSSGTELERSASISVEGLAGMKVQSGILQNEVELVLKLSRKVTLSKGYAYSLEKSVIFTTGANEDTVVFTTVPVDLYQYQVIQHPDPTFLGQIMDAALPREPIYLQVERSFYNSHVAPGNLIVDKSILAHQIGDPESYPTRSEKDALLVQYGGLDNGPQSVGQGSGQTELGLVVGEEWSEGGALELGFEFSAETTVAGFKLGLSIGASVENSLKWTSGQSTTYSGVVGSIDAAHFQKEQYSFGLFTYPVFDPHTQQELEVINYWVE